MNNLNVPPLETESMPVAVRAFALRTDQQPTLPSLGKDKPPKKPSDWVLIFDTETTTDAAQRLRFGTYQLRKAGVLKEQGLFYDVNALQPAELDTLKRYALDNKLNYMPVADFINDVFYGVGYFYRATIVGFNLPFDISRLAIEHNAARGNKRNKIMRGGFTFKLSENEEHPNVQIKHISSRSAFIQFAATRRQRTSRGKRKRNIWTPINRGFFVDCKTLAAALTCKSHSLKSLAIAMGVASQKQETDEHGQTLTNEYLKYAMQDTQATWECYDKLQAEYALHGLTLTESYQIKSEASLGKAYLKEMGIHPWRALQPDFPPEQIGQIMSAYFGGRSEVHIRKQPVQVLYCDFLSMYPTVCTLMNLWQFVIAQGMEWEDTTEVTREFIEGVTLEDLQQPATWQTLTTLVQVLPDEDIFPVRAQYGGEQQYTIGLNHLTCEKPLWFTLADCIASKLLSGKSPKIVQTVTYRPKTPQDGLKSVNIAGNADYAIDPRDGDFFKRVIDLRREVKASMQSARPEDKPKLDSQQLALKILANATSYGIFVELNVEDEKIKQNLICYGANGNPIPVKLKKFEQPGRYFHPVLAALITGAARLKLAITERLILDEGLNWAFCDTDSMAIAKPDTMDQAEFYERAQRVREWFTPLNPYADSSPLLKIEDENYSLQKQGELEPLYCYAISSKRYALYNLDENDKPVLRKVSEHGLGHLLPPYE
jgi:hypothetical protein